MVPISGLEEMLREMKDEFNKPLTRRGWFKRIFHLGALIGGGAGLMAYSSNHLICQSKEIAFNQVSLLKMITQLIKTKYSKIVL